ncbi:unnamed protein product [Ostreobium quekettii]|uniref:Uncharacterized protein n=1 Tax=Ostreobium quekettii TaxID=121088 RepID=A0A8S1IVD5_9CHLO|nr:unnamed protein product [Ostreobium quekettii]|eukprot:evm.model.scf_616EXC.4 EVM.evm.TU.scf_616EXC.4   scf_616EXC:27435-30682(-)
MDAEIVPDSLGVMDEGMSDRIESSEDKCVEPVDVVYWNLLLAFGLYLTNCLISVYMSLGLNRTLIFAGIRCVIQLMVLGYILVPLFKTHHWYYIAAYVVFMLWVAAIEVMSRPSHSYAGMLSHIILAITACTSTVLIYGMLLVIQWGTVEPLGASDLKWWAPQYFIPIAGMLLGNSLSGISLGLTTVLQELATGKDRVEVLLAVGATRFEATKGVVRQALNTALLPMVNQMSVVGIVSIPGMMTGQILAGSPPLQAAKYQIAILFMISTATALGSIIAVFLAVMYIVDSQHRLRSDRLRSRNRPPGIEVWAMVKAISAVESVRSFGRRMYNIRRRNWYSQAPSLRNRNWMYVRAGTDNLDDNRFGALVGSGDLGSDDVFMGSVDGGLQMELEGEGAVVVEDGKLGKK